MASRSDVAECVAAGADALGFIFAESPRRLSPRGLAQELTAAVPPFVTTVGVFAHDSPELIREAIALCRLDVLQFSGDEPPEFCGSFGKPTIVVARTCAMTAEQREAARAIAILIDAWQPGTYGGTGRIVDAQTFLRIRGESPGVHAILAGGLTPSNVAALIRASHPDGVDVRTGVERAGQKDPNLVRAFVANARGALL